MEKIAQALEIENHFERRSSAYFAETEVDVPFLEKEVKTREKYDYKVEFWDQKSVEKQFPFPRPAALYTKPGGNIDPYRLTHGLLQEAIKKGARVFDKTDVLSIEQRKTGITLHTSQGYRISAKKLVIACGYESINYIPFHSEKKPLPRVVVTVNRSKGKRVNQPTSDRLIT